MVKKAATTDPEARSRLKLARAQVALESAQHKRSAIQVEGEQDIERVRRQAARRLEKATETVERCAGAVARAEASLRALQISGQDRSGDLEGSRQDTQSSVALDARVLAQDSGSEDSR